MRMRRYTGLNGEEKHSSYFVLWSTEPISRPPRLSTDVELGDVLFNKVPSRDTSLHDAQVWVYTKVNKGAPAWYDIKHSYSTFSEMIEHPTDPSRYLSCTPSDGKPSWVTLQTWNGNAKKKRMPSKVEAISDEEGEHAEDQNLNAVTLESESVSTAMGRLIG